MRCIHASDNLTYSDSYAFDGMGRGTSYYSVYKRFLKMCAQVTRPAGGARGPEGTVGAPAWCAAEGSPLTSGVAGSQGTSKSHRIS